MVMDNYARQALDMYHEVPNAPKLRDGVCYPWLEPSPDDIENSMGKEDTVFGHCAASLLMKLLYAARMVRLDICYAINSLSRYVTRWNRLCDKQLVHLFGYIKNTKSSKLHAACDRNEIGTACVISSLFTCSVISRIRNHPNYMPLVIGMKLEPLSCMRVQTQI